MVIWVFRFRLNPQSTVDVDVADEVVVVDFAVSQHRSHATTTRTRNKEGGVPSSMAYEYGTQLNPKVEP